MPLSQNVFFAVLYDGADLFFSVDGKEISREKK